MTNSTNNLNGRYVDAQLFSQNSASMLLDGPKPRLTDFFTSIGYDIRPDRQGKGYYAVCPVCRKQNCFIGTDGKSHRIYWKCLDRSGSCESTRDTFRTPRNFLSLVKFITGGQGTALKTISGFLGHADSPFDITNGKTVPNPGYTFVVDDEELKVRFKRAGVYVASTVEDVPESDYRRSILIYVTDNPDDAVVAELKGLAEYVRVRPISDFDGMTDSVLKRRASYVLKVAIEEARRQ